MRVLFLDIDGVLNSRAYFRRATATLDSGVRDDGLGLAAFDEQQIDPEAVVRLNRVIAATEAEVVVSSSWRLGQSLGSLRRVLCARGYEHLLYDYTPVHFGAQRHYEIRAWLAGNKSRLDAFAIVDDDWKAGVGFASRFVNTTYEHGLTDDDAERLIAILMRDSEEG